MVRRPFTRPEWYQQLQRPAWSPPPALFGPVWTPLYVLMAAWLVWRAGAGTDTRAALGLFVVQPVPHAAWSWLFFGPQHPDLGLVDIVVLWLPILATIVAFSRVRPLAALPLSRTSSGSPSPPRAQRLPLAAEPLT